LSGSISRCLGAWRDKSWVLLTKRWGMFLGVSFFYTFSMGNKQQEKLVFLLARCNGAIGYAPLGDEAEYADSSLFKSVASKQIFLPKNGADGPYRWAQLCNERYGNKKICIFVPGVRFDARGTRKGRGGGWYDRFLSKIHPEWIRIGIIGAGGFSRTALARQEWDEPVDWVAVRGASSWKFYETHARHARKPLRRDLSRAIK